MDSPNRTSARESAKPAIVAMLLLFAPCGFAQPNLDWQRIYEGDQLRDCSAHIRTADGGYILSAQTGDNRNDEFDVLVIKTDASGQVEWETLDDADGRSVHSTGIVQTENGGYVVSGTINTADQGYNIYALCLNQVGEIAWRRSYGGDQADQGRGIVRAVDGGFILPGNSRSFGNGLDAYLIHVDDEGEPIWEHNYNFGGQFDMFTEIVAVEDGYVVTGSGSANRRVLLAKIDVNGELEWEQFYDNGEGDGQSGWAVCEVGNDGYAIAGHANVNRNSKGLLIRTESNGDLMWSRRYQGQRSTSAHSIGALPNGGFVLGGSTNLDQFWTFWTDADGDSMAELTTGGYCSSVKTSDDGSVTCAGGTLFSALLLKFTLLPQPYIIHLNENWNLYSAPVIPANINIRAMFAPLVERGTLLMVKNNAGNFYTPANDFNNIPDWDYHQGYLIRMTTDDSLIVRGDPVLIDTPIRMRRGWNMAAYFPESDQPARDAFANLGESLILAKDGSGRFYSPQIGFSNMGNLSRGFGYHIKVTEDNDFVWHNAEGRR